MRKVVSVICCLLLFCFLTTPIYGYSTNMPASVVIGQPDFVSNSSNQGSSVNSNTLFFQADTLINNSRLFIADYANNRVLIFNQLPTSNNQSANTVIGQPDFVSNSSNQGNANPLANTMRKPSGLSTDGTRLFVSEEANNRVLIFNTIPTTNNMSADIVIGQTTMNTRTTGLTASTLTSPEGVFYDRDSGKLLVSDTTNQRVLIFNSIPTGNGSSADVVLGQANFTSGSINRCACSTPAANTLSAPLTTSVYNGKVFVADRDNNRVLIWNSIPTVSGTAADVVIGQPNFTTGTANQGGTANSNTLNQPGKVTIYNGRLFVSDRGNNRILVFNTIPTTNNASADLVIGQPDFTSVSSNQGGNPSSQSLVSPWSTTLNQEKMVVSDTNNHRILIFNNIIDTPQMNIDLPFEKIDDTHLRVRGNIQLGDRPNYSMQWIKADVNGQGLGYVTNFGGGRDNGTNNTLYDFFHEFNPTTGVNTDMNNYTLKLVASSFNADQTSLFYFQPFNFKSLTRTKNNLIFDFSVNKTQIQKIKDNVDHFEIQTSTDSGKFWKKYSTNIFTDKVDINTGQVYTTTTNTLLPGIKYWTRIIAVSRDSNWQQPSNTQNYFVPKKK